MNQFCIHYRLLSCKVYLHVLSSLFKTLISPTCSSYWYIFFFMLLVHYHCFLVIRSLCFGILCPFCFNNQSIPLSCITSIFFLLPYTVTRFFSASLLLSYIISSTHLLYLIVSNDAFLHSFPFSPLLCPLLL